MKIVREYPSLTNGSRGTLVKLAPLSRTVAVTLRATATAPIKKTHHSMLKLPCFSIARSPEASGSAPRRDLVGFSARAHRVWPWLPPLLVVSANSFNNSRINTGVAAVITSNLRLADAPGNVRLPVKGTGLTKASVVNVSQIITVDKTFLTERIGRLNPRLLTEVDDGLRLVLSV